MDTRRELLPLLAITAFAAILRFAFLDQQSFWFDEAVTVELVRKSLVGMLRALPNSESTPPLYYVVAWGWAKIFGTDEVGLRSLSALLGTATVPVTYAIGRLYGSRRAGLFGAALVACSPFLIWYSQEARSYALLVFLSALSVLAFERARRQPTGRHLASWAVIAALALATHYFAAFLVVAEAVWLLIAHGRRWVAWAAVGGVAAVGGALLPLVLHQKGTNQTWWIAARPLSSRVKEALTQFVTGAYSPPHHAAPVLGLLAVVLVGALAWLVEDRYRRGAAIVLLLGGVTVLGPLLLAPTRYDEFFYRNLIGAWALLAVGAAVILASPRLRRFGPLLVAAACAVQLGSLALILHRPALQRDDWRAASRALGAAKPPFGILTNPGFNRVVIEFYRPDVRRLPAKGADVRELVFLGFARLPLDFRPPRGFRRVEERRIQHIALVRYEASRRHVVTAAELAARSGFGSDGMLWDR